MTRRPTNDQLFEELRREFAEAVAAGEHARQVAARVAPLMREIEQRLCPQPPQSEEQ